MVALDVDATLEHVQDPQNTVKVQVLYPDGQAQMIHPKPADFGILAQGGTGSSLRFTSPTLLGQRHARWK